MVSERHPTIAAGMIEGITQRTQGCLRSVVRSAEALKSIGTEIPSWTALSEGARPQNQWPRERDPTEHQHGWKQGVHTHFCGRVLWVQNGPLQHCQFTVSPRMDSEPFWLSSCAVSVCLCPCLSVVALVAAFLTILAITELSTGAAGD